MLATSHKNPVTLSHIQLQIHDVWVSVHEISYKLNEDCMSWNIPDWPLFDVIVEKLKEITTMLCVLETPLEFGRPDIEEVKHRACLVKSLVDSLKRSMAASNILGREDVQKSRDKYEIILSNFDVFYQKIDKLGSNIGRLKETTMTKIETKCQLNHSTFD